MTVSKEVILKENSLILFWFFCLLQTVLMTLTSQIFSKVTNNQGQQEGQNLDLISRILVVVIRRHPHHHPQQKHRDHHDVTLRNHTKIHIHHQGEVIEEKVRPLFSILLQ